MDNNNKHQIMREWVEQFLDDNYLYFESADALPGIRTIVPQYGDYVDKKDILGYKYKSYTFIFIGYEQLDSGTSDVNVINMQVMDDFIEWLEEQIEEQNYPDFGDDCDDYSIEPMQNMANLATVTEDGLAKYMLGVKIHYREA